MSDVFVAEKNLTRELMQPGSNFELSEVSIKGAVFPIFRHCPENLRDFMGVARQYGDDIAVVYQEERWSYRRIFDLADAIGGRLVGLHGVGKGDRVAIAMRNFPEWLSCFLAIVQIGAVAVPINSWGKAAELAHGLKDSGAALAFCDQQRADELQSEADLPIVVVRPGDQVRRVHEVSLDHWLEAACPTVNPVELVGEDLVMIMYSSGTTGVPKGIVWSHRMMVQALFGFKFFGELLVRLEFEKLASWVGKGFSAVNLLAVPLFHFNGLGATSLLSLHLGQKLVMMYKWSPSEALRLIEEERVTSIRIAPAMSLELLDNPTLSQTDTSSLLSLGSGGSATPGRLYDLIEQRLPQVIGSTGYGSTETGIAVSTILGRAYFEYRGCSGPVSPLNQVKIIRADGSQAPVGEPGEIQVRSFATASTSYWQRPEETEATFRDGWYHTGDVGYLDTNGVLYVTDRIKDMVIRGGENIYCVEVENAIYQYPGILEVAAIGVPHEILGEELAAVVVVDPNRSMDTDDLRRFLRGRLAGFKVPAHFFVREVRLPRGATGKILKRELRKSVLDAMS